MSRSKLKRYFRHGMFPQLMVFEAVARLGSVTRAAAELHLAQPTVSVQLKKLSAALDVALFQQRGRRLHLTPAGEALLQSCAELISVLARTEAQLVPFRQPEALIALTRTTGVYAGEPPSGHAYNFAPDSGTEP
ncbi:MAG TPA: LysR family transcriptional regulator [Burkholderiales bacterium]